MSHKRYNKRGKNRFEALRFDLRKLPNYKPLELVADKEPLAFPKEPSRAELWEYVREKRPSAETIDVRVPSRLIDEIFEGGNVDNDLSREERRKKAEDEARNNYIVAILRHCYDMADTMFQSLNWHLKKDLKSYRVIVQGQTGRSHGLLQIHAIRQSLAIVFESLTVDDEVDPKGILEVDVRQAAESLMNMYSVFFDTAVEDLYHAAYTRIPRENDSRFWPKEPTDVLESSFKNLLFLCKFHNLIDDRILTSFIRNRHQECKKFFAQCENDYKTMVGSDTTKQQ